jgi:hypothetical protein
MIKKSTAYKVYYFVSYIMRKSKGLTLIKSPFMINSAIMIINFPNSDESILRKSYNLIPAKAGIQLSAFTFRMALKRFTSCPASAGMTDRFLLIRSVWVIRKLIYHIIPNLLYCVQTSSGMTRGIPIFPYVVLERKVHNSLSQRGRVRVLGWRLVISATYLLIPQPLSLGGEFRSDTKDNF